MFRLLPRLLARGVRNLADHPWATALTVAAVTLVAFLAGLFLLFINTMDRELVRSQGQIQLQVYWKADADQSVVRAQWGDLAKLPYLTDVKTYTPDQALAALSESLEKRADLDWLKGRNPLPATALYYFSLPKELNNPNWARETLERIKTMPGVDKVHYNPMQFDLAQSWIGFSRTVVWPLIIFLTLVLALIVGNTMKLAMLSRRAEVEILVLVGAGRTYIQLPFLAGGAIQGLGGSLLALAMLKGVQVSLHNFLNTAPLMIRVSFLPAGQCLLLIAILTGVGLVSSWVATRSY